MVNKIISRLYIKAFSIIKNDNKGQSLVEYGLIIALIAVVAIGILTQLGGGITATFKKIMDALPK